MADERTTPIMSIGSNGKLVPYRPRGIMAVESFPEVPRPPETLTPVYFSRPAVGTIFDKAMTPELRAAALKYLDS